MTVVQNIEFILIEAGFAFFALFALATRVSVFALLCFASRYYLKKNNSEILFHFHSTSLLLNMIKMYTPDNSNFLKFPLEIRVIGSGLYVVCTEATRSITVISTANLQCTLPH